MKSLFKITVILICCFSSLGTAATSQPGMGVDLTGDIVGGVPIITKLAVKQLPTGRHRFYFLAGRQNAGAAIHVPVEVIKGKKTGKTLLLTAGVHGDELNGIRALHKLMEDIDPDILAGTVISVPGINQTGLVGNSRHFITSAANGAKDDLNRRFPGKLTGGGTAARYVGNIWHNLLKNNADMVVDLHTQTTGTEYPLFVFADMRNAKVKQMAQALMPDIIKNDEGQNGTLETTFMKLGVPAVTYELGAPKVFQPDMIRRAVLGLKNLMVAEGFLSGSVIKPVAPSFVGGNYTNVYAEDGGIVVVQVDLLENVEKGQLIAIGYDAFGSETKRYTAPHAGKVLARATDPFRETGTMLVRIIR
ncbi:succinylglutamate desuccinylase/aspartoacylase family protein [Kordiimonas sp. SCSIO 12603]|uniref:succinylglutamate desuccinylase/aspartoacylase family protein n=1 Tax=Kordiimonas sp. SCSIO 12603 TaxID=2829596 RepID=UPI0021078854|nr:succinylglutamate desuccinylase/aspartoacylase family protein [Kordiimonas sp. SCSIO 12603]UTW58516.1 succinylglutamate desuccinylase/aspartoacylase family protein [Kordiimonas sp. SCSIO 12603]